MEKIFYTFILMAFSFSGFYQSAATTDCSVKHQQKIVKSTQNVVTTFLSDFDCEDCRDKDCRDCKHCAHNCFSSFNMNLFHQDFSLLVATDLESKVCWYINSHYTSPLLDPSLKPPKHS